MTGTPMATMLLTVGPPIGTVATLTTGALTDGNGNPITSPAAPIEVVYSTYSVGPVPYGPTWDLCLDALGNIAVAQPPYAVAQDAASAIRTFAGEVWYDTTLGIPYFAQVLSQPVPLSLVKAFFQNAALTVPGAASAAVFLTDFTNRKLSGQVQITDTTGQASNVGF